MKKTRCSSKSVLQTALMLLALSAPAHAATVVLDWDPSSDADLAGYKVYYQADSAAVPFKGTGAAEGSAPIDVANTTTATINGLDPSRSYFFAVTAYNSAGTESVYSNVIEIAEAMPPVVSITSAVVNAVAANVVTITASASDNAGVTGVQFYANGALIGTVSTAPYVYTWNTSSLTPGTYTISAKATDAAGNVGESSSVQVTIGGDTVPPTVAVTAPGPNASLSGGVTVTANATDNTGVTKIEVYDNGTVAFVSNQNSASYYWDTTLASNGTHTLTAKAYDAAGNVGLASDVTVTVLNDSSAPSVTLAPLGTGTVGGVVGIAANASDNIGVTQVEFYVNGALQSTSTSAPYGFSWNTAVLTNGSYTLSAKAFDAVGNVGQSGTVTVTVFNDTSAPAVSILSPTSGNTATGTVNVAAAASDDVAVSKVEFYLNGILQNTSTSAPYSFTWNTVNVANGSYTISAKAFDAAGNVGQSGSVTVAVFNDTTAPSVSLAAPTTASGTVTVSVAASDDVAVSRVEFYLNGALQSTTTSAPYGFSWNTSNVANGSYTLSAKAFDAAGNVGQSGSVTVAVFNDTTAPSVSVTAPTTASGTVTVSAAASDDVAVSRVEFYLNGALQSTTTSAPYSFNWNTASFANGSYTWTAKAYDAAGNIGQAANVAVTVLNDTTAPTVAFTAPTSLYLNGSNVKISSYATDNVAVAKMELYIDGALKVSTNQSSINFSWNFAKGIHTLAVKAYDTSNNVQTASQKLYRFN
ncbi:Ig-like domain-containing protein [Geomonas sp. RF6]|uniref:Ig-like domain-containing protein n=1 Tax=Geomonas sp. RF6 TaxID=2897342 RepID=UPI001E55E843|nr:Ig-like domain-containing protein [Geomonas sp. RF6]UFS69118.1 Ig-like domain-containing protein [Geomonas sp. RF6]